MVLALRVVQAGLLEDPRLFRISIFFEQVTLGAQEEFSWAEVELARTVTTSFLPNTKQAWEDLEAYLGKSSQ